MHRDKQNNDTVYLEHDGISYVELIHFATVHDNRTNGIENFVPPFQIFVVVVVAAAAVVVVDDGFVDD